MGLADWIATAAIGLALIGVPATIAAWHAARTRGAISRFREVREKVRLQQPLLNEAAWKSADPTWKQYPLPTLTRAGWIPSGPIDLSQVEIRWLDGQHTANDRSLTNTSKASRMLPRLFSGRRHLRYSEALQNLDHMSHLFDGPVYRPISVGASTDGLTLEFVSGNYFGFLDSSEILAFETAAIGGRGIMGPRTYRRALKDPFDLWARHTSLGVLTLTIRRSVGGAGFYMHFRDATRVVVGSDEYHVVPAGEFTPADRSLESRARDFNIWLNILREYAEEFLDVEEALGQGGKWLNYDHSSPYRELNAARASGQLSIHVLGIALDPLTWKPELLTVCIIDAVVFDAVFGANIVMKGKEGTIIVGDDTTGLPFDEETVMRYVTNPATRPGAKACLQLAWEHRAALNLDIDIQTPPSPTEV